MRAPLAIALVVVAGCTRSSTPASTTDAGPTEEQINAQLAANAADAAAQQKAAFEDAVRKGCKLKSTDPVFVVTDSDQRDVCKSLVRDKRTDRSGDLDFSSEDEPLYSHDGCKRIFASWVEGKNAFGVTVRTKFECTLDPKTGKYDLKTH